MKKAKKLPCDGLWVRYKPIAECEILQYFQACSKIDIEDYDHHGIIKKVYDLTVKLGHYVDDLVTPSSLNLIQEGFHKEYELEPVYRKLLNLLLVVLEKEKGIRAPELGSSTYVGQEVPQLTPDTFLNSRLSSLIYDLLESKNTLYEYLEQPQENCGFIILWLCLKEGIDHQKAIQSLLYSSSGLVEIDKHWFFQCDKKRYWLSTKAELLLHRWYETFQERKLSVIQVTNKFLKYKELLAAPNTSIKFGELRQMLKLEYVMTRSSIEYGLSTRKVDSALLPEHAIFRLLNNVRIKHNVIKPPLLATTVRQARSWGSAVNQSDSALRRNLSGIKILELTTKQQLDSVISFTEHLKKASLKESVSIRHQLLEELRPKLESPQAAKKMPWAWLVISWLYHLLKNGGRQKKTLRLDTIKSYVNYVAEPFIAEFNGCDPSLISEVEWAEKMNIVVENIASINKKAYVGYFAEFLIDSELVPGLCLSDIDVPAAQHNPDANIISHHEADRITDVLSSVEHPRAAIAKIVFILGFYAGLRRNEIKGLQFKDFHHYREGSHTLHVRPNKYRQLKSTESSRNLPIDVLIPEPQLTVLFEFLNKAKVKHTSKETSIFHHYSDTELNEGFTMLTQAIKGVTGDETLRFHHCRHSFSNWNILLFYGSVLSNPAGYAFLNHSYFSQKRQKLWLERLGITPFSRKGFWAVGSMLGHSSPETTTSSYFHLADFLRRCLYANYEAELGALRLVWGQRISTDNHGRIAEKPSISERLRTTWPAQSTTKLANEPFDSGTLCKVNISAQSLDGLGLDMYWLIIRRNAEGHSPKNIANDLNVTLDAVSAVLELEARVTGKTLKKSKHKVNSHLNYAKLNGPNIKIVDRLIESFMLIEHRLQQDLNLTLLVPCVENLIGAKDSLVRTTDKNLALTLLRFLKLLDVDFLNVSMKWYMEDVAPLSEERLKLYLKHLIFWRNALVDNVEFHENSLSVVLPQKLGGLHHYFESIAETTVSDDGKFLAYKAPGYVSIHVKQTMSISDEESNVGSVWRQPRRTRAFVSFLRLLTVYLSAR